MSLAIRSLRSHDAETLEGAVLSITQHGILARVIELMK